MKYGSVIRGLATLGTNWKFFDENFRKLRQSQGTPWDQIHSELGLRSHSFRDKPTNHPKRANHEGPYIPNGCCGNFIGGYFALDVPLNTSVSGVGSLTPLPREKNLMFATAGSLPTLVLVEKLALYLE